MNVKEVERSDIEWGTGNVYDKGTRTDFTRRWSFRWGEVKTGYEGVYVEGTISEETRGHRHCHRRDVRGSRGHARRECSEECNLTLTTNRHQRGEIIPTWKECPPRFRISTKRVWIVYGLYVIP